MSSPLDIRPDHLEIVQGILREHLPMDVKVWVFGSRANWTTKDSSDLDLAVEGAARLDNKAMSALVMAFEESVLPYFVDVVDLNAVGDAFKQIVEEQRAPFPMDGDDTTGTAAGEWREVMFSDAVLVNPRVRLDKGETYPFIDMASVNEGSRYAYPSIQREFRGSGSKFQHGDTLMARITPCLENGKIARYHSIDGVSIAHGSTEFIVIRGRPGVTDNGFAYYLTRWNGVREYAISQMTGTSGRQRVPVGALEHLTVRIPPLSEQRAIAHVLGTLDDKIELNRRMNETLEAMARALFKSWFVDFEPVRAKMEGRWLRGESLPGLPADLYDVFPERLAPSELGEIPEGWEVRRLGEVVELNPKEPMKRGALAPYIDMAALPTSGTCPEKVIQREYKSGTRFRNGDTLFARITPCLENGKTAFVQLLPDDTVGWGSTEFIVMRAVSPVPSEYTYLLARDSQFRAFAIMSMTGTSGRQRARTEAIASYLLACPSEKVWGAFSSQVTPLFDNIELNRRQSRALAAQRDALLPELVGGEVRVGQKDLLTGRRF